MNGMHESNDIAVRVARLERENRNLKRAALIGAGLMSCLVLAAWRSPQNDAADTLRVHRLEVVDSRGVPMVSLGTTRNDSGGSITLRDSTGDKKSWWETESGQSRIVFESQAPGSDQKTVAGLSTTPEGSQLSLIGPMGASIQSSVQGDRPHLSLQDSNGKQLFSAPWNR